MKKIALYGGSFNPVHNEHVNILNSAMDELNLDEAYVIPTFSTPNKTDGIIASGKNRYEMCRLAFERANVFVSDFELKSEGISYTYKTCEYFKEKFADCKLYFILGEDMLSDFENWREPERILSAVTLAVCAREDKNELLSSVKKFEAKFNKKVEIFSYVGKAVSSSRVRVLAALGCDFSDLVPISVRDYILNNGLYYDENLASVKNYLTESRFVHTVGVAVFAVENCRKAKVNERDALCASALHDCAKYIKLTDKRLEGFNIPLDVPPSVMHQYTGAYLAEKLFNVKDKNILDAIRFHTTGKINMSPLLKLLYLSDKLEENRHYDGIGDLRALCKKDLNKALIETVSHVLKYLKSESDDSFCELEEVLQSLKKGEV